ncbi:hypothetical protein GCM10023178_03240 [Actinomadura luteofluorescens]
MARTGLKTTSIRDDLTPSRSVVRVRSNNWLWLTVYAHTVNDLSERNNSLPGTNWSLSFSQTRTLMLRILPRTPPVQVGQVSSGVGL